MNPVRVLLVDDSRTQRIILRRQLESTALDCSVEEAGGGLEALDSYGRERPDVVVLDIVMPEMDGPDTLRRMLAMDPSARVVMASSMGTSTAISECLEAGAVSFLQKPFAPEALERALRTACRMEAAS